MTRVAVNPVLIRWARERAGLAQEALATRFKKLPEWEAGETQPTLKQVEAFARAVHVPVGYLFLGAPPEEPVPIPDFRTLAGRAVRQPSPNLLDTIYACQERQSWYRDFARVAQQPEVGFVGSATVETPPEDVAARMRETLGFDQAARRACATWADALRLFIRQADAAGVLIMVSGVVMSNTHRRLEGRDFRQARARDRGDGMTRYLLDANVFIQAKNLHYGFDFCPAFWDWLVDRNQAGVVVSVEKVADELHAVDDDLAAWVGARGAGFFLRPDDAVVPALSTVSDWAGSAGYQPAAVATFLQVADYWLVAHALAHQCAVVTHEVPVDTDRKIKIPNACVGLDLHCMNPYEMLRRERARFVLERVGAVA